MSEVMRIWEGEARTGLAATVHPIQMVLSVREVLSLQHKVTAADTDTGYDESGFQDIKRRPSSRRYVFQSRF
jgi:hypothetical protein